MWIAKNNDLIILAKETKKELEQALQFMVYTSIEETDIEYILYNGEYLTQEEIEQKEREHLDALTLTPADVERALLKAKGWDFEDLKAFLKTKGYTASQIKAIGVELRANNFFRGATMGEEPYTIRIVDAIGDLLGYSVEDMDYLFENKELPLVEENEEE